MICGGASRRCPALHNENIFSRFARAVFCVLVFRLGSDVMCVMDDVWLLFFQKPRPAREGRGLLLSPTDEGKGLASFSMRPL